MNKAHLYLEGSYYVHNLSGITVVIRCHKLFLLGITLLFHRATSFHCPHVQAYGSARRRFR